MTAVAGTLPVDTAIPLLPAGVCQVWWARAGQARPEHDDLLAPADRRRRSRLRGGTDRRQSTVAAAVARLILAAHAGTRPEQLWIDRSCPRCGEQHGKPWLPEAPDLQFSVAHSAGCVAVAVVRGSPVGIDVEELAQYDPEELDCIAHHALAPEERADLARWPARGGRAYAFSTYWTRKEALVKATGEGLAVRLNQIVVSPPMRPPRVERWTGRSEPTSLYDLHPPPGFVAALAVRGASVGLDERDAAPLLAQTSRRLSGATTLSHR
ncbi:4'-phosphopantetheinyl transferase family protein [Geodermatophilus ruber]|uniref:4'-phosphopantetheinyl transferase family protein n=1 Tax=Geodermatophilus ruber TaxID=504800 RepID=UPI0011603AA1|nr:4'-phosphopantetheinyl transferase superfamily protein [Geodermatophilus ruber]